ncbi:MULTISPECIES: DUF4375 domain-containing protein [unclassified Bacillus (in: firmicutes)]|uniref:DMP19 family protein n=1 Tax=unclassified Bacillus (in: firmicutes) TaxID=185979 RepID=UPI0008E13D3B|nr:MULTISPECIES: DUF4375 domain-containing protein [unclassified Bacillus (in: firmicutes)]SFA99590.1 protein of unknown function [Bacillus sp. UNCCL13]SFQ81718.1 protein of unknown function [Bacillus sp. cl95]
MNINFEEFVFRNDDDLEIINDANWIITTRKHDLALMTEGEKTIIHILRLVGEVGNGGFEQYFYNTQGQFLPETLDALERINDSNVKSLFQKAVICFNSDKVETLKEEEWYKLDKQFYNYDMYLYKLMVKYIRDNIEQFV